MRYLPGVDGLRGLAVVAVVLYHADVEWLPAGFLGVDVFFVISGYLITSLLLAEHAGGGIDVGGFWRRRARRLLPALLALLGGVTVAAVVLAPDAAPRLVGDLPAAGAYVSNWWQILEGESYFETIGRPPLLRHLWSLAVEEQFYVVAPVVVLLVLRRGTGRRVLALGAVVLAVASAALMAAVWSPEEPARAYYGTDTRGAPLLLGVALAAVWPPSRLRAVVAPGARTLLDVVGAVSIGGVAWIAVTADEFGSGLFRGGFLLAATLAALAVAVAAHPASRLGQALASGPLVWLGTRSYSLYLWHWPVIVLTRPHLDVALRGWPLLALRVAVSLALAEASWRWIEQPFRDGRAQAAFRSLRPVERRRIAGLTLAGMTVAWLAVVAAVPPRQPVSLVAASETPSTLATWPSSTAATTTSATTSTTSTTLPATTVVPAIVATTVPPPPPAPPPPGPPAGPVLAVGDSVLLASKPALERASNGMVQVDAAVGRQVWDTLDLLERYRAVGAWAQLSGLVVHLGTNGPLSGGEFERLAAAVDGVPRVLVLTVRVPKRWEETSNATIREGVPRHPAMRLVDWHAVTADASLLGSDGVHPTGTGMGVYARIVLEQLVDVAPPAPPPPPPTMTLPPPPPPTTLPPPPSTAPPPPPETTATTVAV